MSFAASLWRRTHATPPASLCSGCSTVQCSSRRPFDSVTVSVVRG